jgi:integrase/recombinase XerD
MTSLAPVLEGYFLERLTQRRASPNTIASYRDTFRLLLGFAQRRTGHAPSVLDMAELDADLIGAFLDHLERDRANGIVTRNLRLTAIHSLFAYAALRCPEHAETIRRVLAIPAKRPDTTIVSFLTRAETAAVLAAPDRATPRGESREDTEHQQPTQRPEAPCRSPRPPRRGWRRSRRRGRGR